MLVEHDMGLVISTSDRITALDFGTVLTTGSPAEVSNDQRVIEAYLGHSRAKDAGMPELQPEPDSTVSPPPTRTDHDG